MGALKAIGVVGLIVALATPAAGQDPLATAKDLYASASYEEALSTLARLSEGASPDVARQIEQYRAFSLYALGRTTEAEQVAEALIRRNPQARLPPGETSPRIESMFASVRKRVLPALIRDEYRTARAAIDRGDLKAAEPNLALVSQVLAELRASGTLDESLSDLSLLVDGFLGLSRASAAQQTAPAVEPAGATRPAAPMARTPTASSGAGTATTVYSGAGDGRLTPPVVINQSSPAVPRAVAEVMKRSARKSLVVELLIDERGDVEEASITEAVLPVYDLLVLRSARQWKYRPALFDGTPVTYRKSVTITFQE